MKKVINSEEQAKAVREIHILYLKCMKCLAGGSGGKELITAFWYFHVYKAEDYFYANLSRMQMLPIEQIVSEMVAVCEKSGV